MTKQEKLLLLQLILEDVRSNWAFSVRERISGALELAEELKDVEGMDELIETIKDYEIDTGDGRYFRDNYPCGYLEMDSLHELEKTFNDKSDEFKKKAKQLLTYPEYRFKDWRERSKNYD